MLVDDWTPVANRMPTAARIAEHAFHGRGERVFRLLKKHKEHDDTVCHSCHRAQLLAVWTCRQKLFVKIRQGGARLKKCSHQFAVAQFMHRNSVDGRYQMVELRASAKCIFLPSYALPVWAIVFRLNLAGQTS